MKMSAVTTRIAGLILLVALVFGGVAALAQTPAAAPATTAAPATPATGRLGPAFCRRPGACRGHNGARRACRPCQAAGL